MEIPDNPLIEPAIINLIRDRLVHREGTVAAAESVTSGLVQAAQYAIVHRQKIKPA